MIGQTISHYKIIEKLGEGGMGVVYKAEDTKLDRMVALKFLPSHLNASEDDKKRFIQEAKAASAMNHPNICTIYSIEEHEDQIFIAMEFVDGRTLRQRKETTSLKQAIEMGIQIADGLAAAHEKGIVHRDIKPENIMIRKDGIVQIMDFGLAKLRGVSRLTKEGSTVGTAGYMSPEQVQGQDADHRSDIFSLGALIYELLTGQLPFKGVHETAIMYEVVNVDAVPPSAVVPEIEPELDRIVLECLQKEPDERCQSAKEVSKDLKRFKRESGRQRVSRISSVRQLHPPTQSTAQMPIPDMQPVSSQALPSKPASSRLWMIIAAALFIALCTALFFYWKAASIEIPVLRATILPPEKGSFDSEQGAHFAISPDGHAIAFVGTDSSGKKHLWVRQLNTNSPMPLPGTDNASYPFWSYDSKTIGFFADSKLKKVDAAGGPPLALCEAEAGRGGTWNQDGIILFCPSTFSPIHQVSAAGGTPTAVTALDTSFNETNHRMPFFLPDGNHFLFVSQTATSGAGGFEEQDRMYVGSLDGKTNQLMKGASNMTYSSGYLFFVRQSTLMAQAFDAGSQEFDGNAFPLVENINFSPPRSKGAFSVSNTGILVYLESTSSTREVYIADRRGAVVHRYPMKSPLYAMNFSLDGKKIVYDNDDRASQNQDIWVFDIARQVNTRFTFDNTIEILPMWSPDASQVVYTSFISGKGNLFLKDASGTKKEELLFSSGENMYTTDWSHDGKYLLLSVQGGKTKWDIAVFSLGEKKITSTVKTEFNEWVATFSPDGQWFAYQSDESGRFEVYVRPTSGGGAKWQISTGGGENAHWKGDGKELYFASNGKLMAVAVNSGGGKFEVGIPHPLFDLDPRRNTEYIDVSQDGQQFIIRVENNVQGVSPMQVVTNFPVELKKK
ncbi:MAG TPA: protein kinase [Bacteroidota bacterium]